MGNALRAALKDGAALARAGIAAIRQRRADISGDPDLPASSHAFILHQLKNPAEADLLREVYGASFVLVAGHAPRLKRVDELAQRIARKEDQRGQERHFRAGVESVVEADEKQEHDFGQNTRDTYPKADFFANLGVPSGAYEIRRFVELMFGHPFHTPLPEEYAMYQASATALRSSDDNRQVGAVVVDVTYGQGKNIRNAEVIASGMNEVPRAGGGYYWQKDSPDLRDQALLAMDEDRANEIKISALAELLGKMRLKQWLEKSLVDQRDRELARTLLKDLKRTQFMDIGEFSRPVHAEMAALLDGARRGVSVNGHSMYVTTFPCHNCAKHIIAAGIKRVIYLEPYPKSRAGDLHREEIELESVDGNATNDKVVFWAFSGIAPRQYRQLFMMAERGAQKGNSLNKWTANRRSSSPLYVSRNAWNAYVAAERQELGLLDPEIYRWEKDKLCPTPTSDRIEDQPQTDSTVEK
jgi:cytidine deaminase